MVARPMCMRTSRESRDIMKINTNIREQSTQKTLGGFFNFFCQRGGLVDEPRFSSDLIFLLN